MRFFSTLVLGCAIFIGGATQADAHCTNGPVRKTVKAVACAPVLAVQAWNNVQPVRKVAKVAVATPVLVARGLREVKPVRRVASLPFKFVRRWGQVRPVRSVLGRLLFRR